MVVREGAAVREKPRLGDEGTATPREPGPPKGKETPVGKPMQSKPSEKPPRRAVEGAPYLVNISPQSMGWPSHMRTASPGRSDTRHVDAEVSPYRTVVTRQGRELYEQEFVVDHIMELRTAPRGMSNIVYDGTVLSPKGILMSPSVTSYVQKWLCITAARGMASLHWWSTPRWVSYPPRWKIRKKEEQMKKMKEMMMKGCKEMLLYTIGDRSPCGLAPHFGGLVFMPLYTDIDSLLVQFAFCDSAILVYHAIEGGFTQTFSSGLLSPRRNFGDFGICLPLLQWKAFILKDSLFPEGCCYSPFV